MKRKKYQKSLWDKILEVLKGYAKTQFIIVCVVAVLAWVSLWALGVQFPLVLGLFTGALSLVPMWGIIVAAIFASAMAIFDGSRFLPQAPVIFEGVIVVMVYGLLNMLVDYVLAPYFHAQTVRMHPLLLLLLIVLVTSLFGIWGALLTVPAILVVKTTIVHYKTRRD